MEQDKYIISVWGKGVGIIIYCAKDCAWGHM